MTGGASLTPGLSEQLRDLVGLPVEMATPREQLAIGDIGFPPDRVDTIDPYLPAPVGLALGGLATGRRIDLVGGEGMAAAARRRLTAVAAVIAVLLLIGLGAIWWVRKSALDTEKDRLASEQTQIASLNKEKASLSDAQTTQAQIDALQAQVQTELEQDISWARMLQDIARTIPNDTWLTAFQGTSSSSGGTSAGGGATLTPTTPTSPTTAAGGATTTTTTAAAAGATPATPVTPAAPTATVGGTATFTVVGLDFRSVAAWIQRIGTQIPSFSNLWVPNASRGGQTAAASGRDFVNFSSTATITAKARSDRLDKLKRSEK